MKLHSTVNVLGISILLAAFANGQTKKLLMNDDVVEMVKAGFEESTVVKLIQSSDTSFDTSVSALIALKKAGVSEQIISAVLQKRSNSDRPSQAADSPSSPSSSIPIPKSNTATPPGAASPARTDNDPWPGEVTGMEREIGIYYKQKGSTFVALYGKPIVATKTGGFLKTSLTMGVSKIRSKGQIPGKHAPLQVEDRAPTFYFYMPEGEAPDRFTVIGMQEKGNRREFEVGSAGGATGAVASGLDIDKVSQIAIARIAPRLYRVKPDRELDDGEYGFVGTFTYTTVGVAGTGEKIYDFGVPKKR